MTKTQKKAVVLIPLITVLIIAVLYGINREKKPFPIAFIGALSGKYADLGIDCRRGAELAVRKINAAGGVNGKQLVLDARDDAQDVDRAKEEVSELLAMEVPVIIGHVTSSMSMATLPLINNSDTLLVSPTTSTPLLKDRDDNFIRTCAVSTDAALMMAKYLRDILGAERAGVIYDMSNRAYTELWYENFRKKFLESGGETVFPLVFTSAPDVELLPLVHEMRQSDPDALVLVANSVDAALISQQVRKIDWQVPLAMADWAATEQLIHLGGEAVEGAVISQYFNRKSRRPQYINFKNEYEAAYKTEPGFGSVHSYNAVMMVATAMEQQRRDESLKEAILRISEFTGLQGEITINQYGDSSNPTFIGVVRDGNFVILEDFR